MRHSPKQPWITHKVLFFQPSSCWELTYGPCRFVSRRHLMWNASAELRTPASSWEPLCFICKVRTFPFTPGGGIWMFQPEEVRGPKFFPFRLTAWLWVVLFPSCNRRAPLSKTFTLKWGDCGIWFPSVQKCLTSCWPQTPTPCEEWCFSCFWWPAPEAFRHEQPSVGNALRNQAPPPTEVRNQEVPLYCPNISLTGKT